MGNGNSSNQQKIERSKSQQNFESFNFTQNNQTGQNQIANNNNINQQKQNIGTQPNSLQNTERNLEFVQQIKQNTKSKPPLKQGQNTQNQDQHQQTQKSIVNRQNSNSRGKYKNSIDLESQEGQKTNIIKEDQIDEQLGEEEQIKNQQEQNKLRQQQIQENQEQKQQQGQFYSRPVSNQSKIRKNTSNSIIAQKNEQTISIQRQQDDNSVINQELEENNNDSNKQGLNRIKTIQNLNEIKQVNDNNKDNIQQQQQEKMKILKQQTIKQQQLDLIQKKQEEELKKQQDKQREIDEIQKKNLEEIAKNKQKAEEEIQQYKKEYLREQKLKIKKHSYKIEQEIQKEQAERQKINEELERERLKLERIKQQRLKEEAQEAYRLQQKMTQQFQQEQESLQKFNQEKVKSRSRSGSVNRQVYTPSKNTPAKGSLANTPTNRNSKIGKPQKMLLSRSQNKENLDNDNDNNNITERKDSMGVIKAFKNGNSKSIIRRKQEELSPQQGLSQRKGINLKRRSSKSVNFFQSKLYDEKEEIEKQKYEKWKKLVDNDPDDPVEFFKKKDIVLTPRSQLKIQQKNKRIQKLLHKLYLSKTPGYSQDDYPHIFTPKHVKQKSLSEQKKIRYQNSVSYILKKQKEKEQQKQQQKENENKIKIKKKPRPREISKIPVPQSQNSLNGISQENSQMGNTISYNQTYMNTTLEKNYNTYKISQTEEIKYRPMQTIQNSIRPQTQQYYQYNPPVCQNCTISNHATRSQINSRNRQVRSNTSYQTHRKNYKSMYNNNSINKMYNQEEYNQEQQEIAKLRQKFPQMNDEQLHFYRKISDLSQKIDVKTQNQQENGNPNNSKKLSQDYNFNSSEKLPYLNTENNNNEFNNIDNFLQTTPEKYKFENYEDKIITGSPYKPGTTQKKQRPNRSQNGKRIQRSQSTYNHNSYNQGTKNSDIYILQGQQTKRIETIKNQMYQQKQQMNSTYVQKNSQNSFANYKKQNSNYLLKYQKNSYKGQVMSVNKHFQQQMTNDESFHLSDLNESKNYENQQDLQKNGVKSIKAQYFLLSQN